MLSVNNPYLVHRSISYTSNESTPLEDICIAIMIIDTHTVYRYD